MLIENIIVLTPESKKDFINKSFDGKLSQILITSSKESKEEWYIQAKRVLEILQEDSKVHKSLQDYPVLDDNEPGQKESITRKNTLSKGFSLPTNLIPQDVYQLLTRGYDVKVYSEDGSSRWMNIFIASDLSDIRCKRPTENFIKPKWILKIHHIKTINAGYDKNSPIRKSSDFYFKKLPKQELCIAIFGEYRIDGQKNFHILFDSAIMCNRIFEGFSYVHSMHKKFLLESLKRENV